jgi:hypothetical protein
MVARVAKHAGGDDEKLREIASQRMVGDNSGLPAGCRRAIVLVGHGHRLFGDRAAIVAAQSGFESAGEENEKLGGKP